MKPPQLRMLSPSCLKREVPRKSHTSKIDPPVETSPNESQVILSANRSENTTEAIRALSRANLALSPSDAHRIEFAEQRARQVTKCHIAKIGRTEPRPNHPEQNLFELYGKRPVAN